jgi:hypothetical protein
MRLARRNGRHATIVEAHHVHDFGGFGGVHHLLGFVEGVAERLFAEHGFTGLRGGNGHRQMLVAGRRNVDDVDVGALDQLAKIGFVRFPAEAVGGFLDVLLIATANGAQHRLDIGIEKLIDLTIGVRVRLAHKGIADEADADFFLCHESLLLARLEMLMRRSVT